MVYELKDNLSRESYPEFEETLNSLRATDNLSVLAHVRPDDKNFFLVRGWAVAGIATNHFGLGLHALKMSLQLNQARDGVLNRIKASNTHETLAATEVNTENV